jgi:uncharacterized protein YunC (DUF1805 family)
MNAIMNATQLASLHARHEIMQTPHGPVLGTSYRWPGGQYCAIHTERGIVGCGIYDVHTAGKFQMAVAIARGTPEHPLCEPEDLFKATIAEVSEPAAQLGISKGMSGLDALAILLAGR